MKKLTIGAVLFCILAGYGVFESVWALVATAGFIQTWADMMATTAPTSAVPTMAVQFFAVYHLVALVALAIIAVIPLRRAEKWAWYTALILGGFGLGWGVALWAPYAPFMYILVALWVAALAISAQPVLRKA
ncbi:hypothetical protein ACFLUT_03720 [Chloroflexota bacterium]